MDTVKGFFARKDDNGGRHGRGKTVVRTRAVKSFGPYTVEAVSSAGRKDVNVDVDGMPKASGKVVGGFAALRLYDKREISEDNERGMVGERKWQVDDWREVEVAMAELVALAAKELHGERRTTVVANGYVARLYENDSVTFDVTFDSLFI